MVEWDVRVDFEDGTDTRKWRRVELREDSGRVSLFMDQALIPGVFFDFEGPPTITADGLSVPVFVHMLIVEDDRNEGRTRQEKADCLLIPSCPPPGV